MRRGGTRPRISQIGTDAIAGHPCAFPANLKTINPLFDLTGRTALITGSSQGIGFALARGLAQAGAGVVLNGRDAAKLAFEPNGLDIPDLRLNRLVTKLLIAEDQSVNLVKVLRTAPSNAAPPAPANESTSKSNDAVAQASEDPFPVRIRRIRF